MAETVQSIAAAETPAIPARRAARYWEVDAWRGMAVITMIIYHLGWDLSFFGVDVSPYRGGWYLLQRFTCISFIGLAGLSLTLGDRAMQKKLGPGKSTFPYFLRRGVTIFAWGMVLTVVMWVAGSFLSGDWRNPAWRIDFGVLHLIGFSIVAAWPLRRFKWLNLALWAVLFVAGSLVERMPVDTHWLVWLGFHPNPYYAVDYFPIIPWFGVALLGVFLGNLLYTERGLIYPLPDWGDRGPVRFLRWLGSHSLVIYLTHQLVLFGLLFAIFWALGMVRF